MIPKKKIAIIISSPVYIKHYLLNNAFSEIEKDNELILLLTDGLDYLASDNRFKKYKIVNYKYSKFLKKVVRFINELSLFKHYTESKDFAYRIKRKYNDSPHLNDGTLNARRIDHRIKVFIVKSFFRLFAKKRILKLSAIIGAKIFSIESPIQKFLRKQKVDILICPCTAAGTEEFDIGAYTSLSTKRTKTIFIIDNWDNLSSKYVMQYLPDHVIVWGEQTKLHGIVFQKINPERITALGTPRFYCYSKDFKTSKKQINLLPKLPLKYILYLGTQTFFNENLVLNKLNKLIKEKFNEYELIYRPHPWREKFSKNIQPLEGITLDPTLNFCSETHGSMLLPKQDLYHHIISNSTLLIGGCTSMIVECSLMRKPYLLLAHDDGNPIQSPFEYFKSSEHQNLTPFLNNVSVCYSLDKLYEKINFLINKKIGADDQVLENIISSKYANFNYHLNQLIKKI